MNMFRTKQAGTSKKLVSMAVAGTMMMSLLPGMAFAVEQGARPAEAASTTVTVDADTCGYQVWSSTAVYTAGNRVYYNGKIYEAKWWTQNERPDLSGEWGAWKFISDCTSTGGDTLPPSTPANLRSTGLTSSSVSLAWDASTDNVGVAGYNVYNGSALATTVTGTTATVSGLAGSTTYNFTVKAKDAAGNISAASNQLSVTTQSGGTTPQPTGRKYITYASTWNTSIYDLKPENIPTYITNVNLAFARPDTAYQRGSYAFDQAVAGFEFVEGATTNNGQKKFTAQQAQDLRNNIATLKARGTETWVSVGGWAYSQGSQWASFNAPRVVDLALDLGAGGIDIDWESDGNSCNKLTAEQFSCSKDGEVAGIISSLYNEIKARGATLKISIAGWSTGAYYVKGTPFEEGKVQWGSPFGGVMYRVVKDHGSKIDFINLMSYDAGDYYDPREGYESYRAIYNGPINMGMEIAPEGAGGAVLEVNAPAGTVYDADMLTGQNNMATQYYNVETMVKYIKNKGRANDGFMLWQLWKQRVHQPAPAGAATENSAGQYVCNNLPLAGNCGQWIPSLPKLTP
ncbi:glycosyl hydrolase family 18 protein [Brevibacillus dissolubilis]|uniref:glycosyl hydrolase family 18 protein n=1 Tax=Brevibacillus dissolubilis TaxID=1844116 RepID=UPI0021003F19|nr:glycosyl hydrolase family 18 protein [Brevibacillus dissolubilis]